MVSFATYPKDGLFGGKAIATNVVFYYGWITAISTGLGVLPFACMDRSPRKNILGMANAVAAGMMLSASVGLVIQGLIAGGFKTFGGVCIGWVFILGTKSWLDKHEVSFKFGFFHPSYVKLYSFPRPGSCRHGYPYKCQYEENISSIICNDNSFIQRRSRDRCFIQWR